MKKKRNKKKINRLEIFLSRNKNGHEKKIDKDHFIMFQGSISKF